MLASFCFVIVYLLLLVGFLRLKKSDKKLNFYSWLFIGIFVSCCWEAFIVGIMNMIHIPIHLFSISTANLLLASGIWYFGLIKKKEVQEYGFPKIDLVMYLLLFVTTLSIGMIRFGSDFSVFSYYDGDSARHFRMATEIIQQGMFNRMYFTHLGDAILIEIFSPWVINTYWYRMFLFYDVYLLFIAGAIFWVLIREFLDSNRMIFIGIVATFMYLMGYPLNNFLYGVEYWGAGVVIVTLILLLIRYYTQKEINEWYAVVMLMLANVSLCVCYTLFVPSVFIGEVIFLLIYLGKQKKIWCKTSIAYALIAYLVPSLFIIFYFILQLPFDVLSSVSSAMQEDGKVYRDFYSNFIFLFLFIVLYLFHIIKNKVNDTVFWMSITLLIHISYNLIQILSGNAVTYFYYKNYNLLWLFAFYVSIKAIYWQEGQTKSIINAYFVVIITMLVICFTNVESKINAINEKLVSQSKAYQFFDLYYANKEMLLLPETDVTPERQDIYNRASLLAREDNAVIPIIPLDYFWFYEYYYYVTNQDITGLRGIGAENTDIKPYLDNANYCVVEKVSQCYAMNKDLFDSYPVVYENDYAIICKLK